MKKWLTLKETIFVTSMLFGLFFGAGNLIFPVYMGQLAGRNVYTAIIGFLITGVTLPLLAVAALGKSRSNGLYELGLKVSKPFSIFFTCALYLTIGPFFAIPRCATTSFTVGVTPLLGSESSLYLLIFTLVFFLAAAFFALRPSEILTWVGKFLNPIFLLFLAILIIRGFAFPMGVISEVEPTGAYLTSSLFEGFYEGYNTMDALAGLAFGIIVVTVIKKQGIKDGDSVANNTILSGIFSCILMGIIYIALSILGTQSANVIGICSNGGEALGLIAEYYYGKFGALLLAGIVTMACLKTAVGLITSCAATFNELFPNKLTIKQWSLVFLVVSFLIANLGLNQIISYSIPVLIFLYPLSIVLILLALFSNFYKKDQIVYTITMYFTLPAAILELLKSLPFENKLVELASNITNSLPLGSIGLGWLTPSLIGFVVAMVYVKCIKKRSID